MHLRLQETSGSNDSRWVRIPIHSLIHKLLELGEVKLQVEATQQWEEDVEDLELKLVEEEVVQEWLAGEEALVKWSMAMVVESNGAKYHNRQKAKFSGS